MSELSECVGYFRQNKLWEQIFKGFRNKYMSYGSFSGKVTVRNLTNQDIEELEGFFGRSYHGNKSVTISADKFKKALGNSRFREIAPEQILEAYFGENLISRDEIRQKKAAYMDELRDRYRSSFRNTPAYNQMDELCSIIKHRGSVNDNDRESKLWLCADIYNKLPCRQDNKMYLAVFAAMVTGNPHAFDYGTTEGNLLYEIIQLYLAQERRPAEADDGMSSAYKRQKLLLRAGITIDGLSNYTMMYNIHAFKKDGSLHRGIEGFYQEKEPVQISLNTISDLDRIECIDNEIYVVENPSVFATICEEKSCMCMNGQPRLAGLMVLEILAKSGIHVYYSGDLDPEGLVIAQKLSQFYKGKFSLWHMGVDDYARCRSKEKISDRRIKMLDKISDERLLPTSRLIADERLAGYQENILDFFDK